MRLKKLGKYEEIVIKNLLGKLSHTTFNDLLGNFSFLFFLKKQYYK